jgi:hypothetical protein
LDQVGTGTEQQPAPRSVWHRIAASLVEVAIIAGILVRSLHVLANAHGGQLDWHSFVGTFIAVPVVLLALATVHLSSYPLNQWVWRAPAFALAESAVESVFSLILIAAGRERWGTGRAVFSDWPAMAATTFLSRFAMVCIFALILGGVAQFVRRREIHAERKRGRDEGGGGPGGIERRTGD